MTSDDESIFARLAEALVILESSPEFAKIIPEVRSNCVFARDKAKSIEEVAAIQGRITVVDGRPKAVSHPKFGASSHVARKVLTIMKHAPTKRAGINIRYDPKIIELLKTKGLSVASFDRKDEPKDIKTEEGGTMEWGIERAIEISKTIPDVVCDPGDFGKEPMICIFGEDPVDVAEIAISVAKNLVKTNPK